MCTNARISLTAGFAAASIFALCPLAAQAKNSGSSGHTNIAHSSGSKVSNGKSNMHTVPLTKVSHDSGKYKTSSKHDDSQYCHEDYKCHDKSCDHCHDHDYCKDHCHDHDYCKDHCHDHYCKDHCHDCCHDHCCHDCWPCGFCWDFPCFDGCCFGGCDGGCCDCDDGCDCGEQVIIVNNNGCDDNGSVVVDGE